MGRVMTLWAVLERSCSLSRDQVSKIKTGLDQGYIKYVPVLKGRSVKLVINLHLILRLIMGGMLFPLFSTTS